MSRQIAMVSIRCTGAELRAAMQERADDTAALIFFLIGAEKEGLMLQGRTAKAALEASCRLLDISEEKLARLKEAVS